MTAVTCCGFPVIACNVLLFQPLTVAWTWCSLAYGASIMQDKNLSEYSLDGSSTSKALNCSHQLCNMGPDCKCPTESCPYTVQYRSEATSSSGLLVEDVLHLSSSNSPSNASSKASIFIWFDKEVNAVRADFDLPWEYCYESRGQVQNFPSVKLMLSNNESFVVQQPIFVVPGSQGILGYCLALQSIPGDVAIIGQNFMTGYRMVFDRENLQFGWSRSDCQDRSNSTSDASKSPNSLPTDEEQRRRGHAVAPAIAGRAPSNTSDSSRSVNVFLSRLLCVLIFSGMNMLKYAM